jgi:hypothetical protein
MIAYFILVHRYPEQFKRLFTAIYRQDYVYVIHIDKNTSKEVHRSIKEFLREYSNVQILTPKYMLWGGYSLVDAQLRGIRLLRRMSTSWDFCINLSGQDFPLKSQEWIARFLSAQKGTDFLKVLDQQDIRPDTNSRVEFYYIELKKKLVNTLIKRKFLSKATPYIGNQWMILSRPYCDFIDTSREVRRFRQFYLHTLIPDEAFFQTVIMNTSYTPNLVNDDLREIDWIPDGSIKLRPRTFTIEDADLLRASTQLFARKFDETVDDKIFDILEAHIATQT